MAGQERLALGERPVLARVVKVRRLAVGVGRGSRFSGEQDWYGLCRGSSSSRKILSEDLLFLKRRLG